MIQRVNGRYRLTEANVDTGYRLNLLKDISGEIKKSIEAAFYTCSIKDDFSISIIPQYGYLARLRVKYVGDLDDSGDTFEVQLMGQNKQGKDLIVDGGSIDRKISSEDFPALIEKIAEAMFKEILDIDSVVNESLLLEDNIFKKIIKSISNQIDKNAAKKDEKKKTEEKLQDLVKPLVDGLKKGISETSKTAQVKVTASGDTLDIEILSSFIILMHLDADPKDPKKLVVSDFQTPLGSKDIKNDEKLNSLERMFKKLNNLLGMKVEISQILAKKTGRTDQQDEEEAEAEQAKKSGDGYEADLKAKLGPDVLGELGIPTDESLGESLLKIPGFDPAKFDSAYKMVPKGSENAFIKYFLLVAAGIKQDMGESVPVDVDVIVSTGGGFDPKKNNKLAVLLYYLTKFKSDNPIAFFQSPDFQRLKQFLKLDFDQLATDVDKVSGTTLQDCFADKLAIFYYPYFLKHPNGGDIYRYWIRITNHKAQLVANIINDFIKNISTASEKDLLTVKTFLDAIGFDVSDDVLANLPQLTAQELKIKIFKNDSNDDLRTPDDLKTIVEAMNRVSSIKMKPGSPDDEEEDDSEQDQEGSDLSDFNFDSDTAPEDFQYAQLYSAIRNHIKSNNINLENASDEIKAALYQLGRALARNV